MAVFYEWDIEEVIDYHDGDNDIQNHLHQPNFEVLRLELSTLKEYVTPAGHVHYDPVLVCDDDQGRSWAYIEDGKLPEFFEDAYQCRTRKVPKRFHKEIARVSPNTNNTRSA